MSRNRSNAIDLLLAYYGDDFTGSTDVLETLTTRGVETVLFTEPPGEEMLRRYAHVRAIGVAGNSRTMSPDAMDETLPEIFRALSRQQPRIVHYKVCSTFDSSPSIGSIGRAIDIGQQVFDAPFVPVVVGTPSLQRFCVFGNLFARSGLDSAPYRLDRHPSMRAHPITPMTEADLRVHLASQTSRLIELIDVTALERGYDATSRELKRLTASLGTVVLFDTLTEAHLATIGRLLWETQARAQKPLFVVGSSGIDHALAKHWQNSGIVSDGDVARPTLRSRPRSVDRVLVVSGSCSPVTDRQIAWAIEHGFAELPVDIAAWRQSEPSPAEVSAVASRIASILDTGRSVIAHTSRGPNYPRWKLEATTTVFGRDNVSNLGIILGRIAREVVRNGMVQRIGVVGGDTAGDVARCLGISVLEYAAGLDPGAPLCVARSPDPAIDGLEICFKGGQVGYNDFFGTLLSGQPSR